jgi:crotonobetaine/carnitine-CoA ligase
MHAAYQLPLEQRLLAPILAAQAKQEGERPYLTFGDRTWTFGETHETVRAIARGLRELGVQKRESVGMLLHNSANFVFSWYACTLVGAVFVPINPSYTGYMLEYVLGDANTRGLIIDRDLAPALATLSAEALARLQWVAVIGGTEDLSLPQGPALYLDYAALPQFKGPDPEIPTDFRDLQSIMYTSGTTGPSKGVMLPNAHFFGSSMTFLRALAMDRDDVLFTPLPLFHGLASRLGVLPALMVGAHVIVAERFSASKYWQQVTECGASVSHCMFTIPPILKAQPPGPWDKAHKLRAMFNANSDPEFERRFNVRLVEAYGATETGLTIYTAWPERKVGSCGKAHEDWEIALVDDNDLAVSEGEVGQVVARPRRPWIMMEGYINKPVETLRTTRNLWYHSGDYARRDADGYFFFVGRLKEHIRRRGENLSAFEIERIISNHADVAECAAVAYPAADGEDDIRCVIVRRVGSTLTAPELMDWLQPSMPPAMLPRYIEFVAVLPYTPSQKVEKYKLIEDGLAADAWDRKAVGYKTVRELAGKK